MGPLDVWMQNFSVRQMMQCVTVVCAVVRQTNSRLMGHVMQVRSTFLTLYFCELSNILVFLYISVYQFVHHYVNYV